MSTNSETPTENNEVNFLSMSDDEIMNTMPPDQEQEEQVQEEQEAEQQEQDQTVHLDPPEQEDDNDEENVQQDSAHEVVGYQKPVQESPEQNQQQQQQQTVQEPVDDTTRNAQFYDYLTSPFKANGKDFKVESAEEARNLIQKGVNFTQKMQVLQPALRVVKMLENNDLMDEAQISYLIDLAQKKPEAIQKLLADSEFDPMAMDEDVAKDYLPTDHRVSEKELVLQSVLDDLETTEHGQALITEVARQWDEESKQAVLQDPQYLSVLNEQRSLGLYTQITDEMERLRILGEIPVGTPFLQAYNAVGQYLREQGRLQVPSSSVTPPPPQPVATKTVIPQGSADNSDRVKATAPPRSVPSTSQPKIDVLNMSDEEFMKQTEGRF